MSRHAVQPQKLTCSLETGRFAAGDCFGLLADFHHYNMRKPGASESFAVKIQQGNYKIIDTAWRYHTRHRGSDD